MFKYEETGARRVNKYPIMYVIVLLQMWMLKHQKQNKPSVNKLRINYNLW